MDTIPYDTIIIGSGHAGLTAAIYSARARLKTLVIAGITPGGQLMNTTLVENYPGFKDGVMGPQLMMDTMEQAKKQGAEFVNANADSVDFSGEVKSVVAGGTTYLAKSVILATGSSPRRLGIPGEDKFYGRGVSTCATCDGAFYKEKVVAVIGGGDTAMQDATFIARFAKKVYLVHRRNEFRASKVMQERAMATPNIEVVWNTEVQEVLGDEVVTGLKVYNSQEIITSELTVDGMFLAIGHVPNTQFLGTSLKLNEEGFAEVTDRTHSSVEGVFIAGDVYDHIYQQAVTAAGMGCMAAIDAQRWLASK